MCGIEALYLSLKLATELVDKPWAGRNSTIVFTPAVNYPPLSPWESARRDAAEAEARDAKLKEFQQMVKMCVPEPKPLSDDTRAVIKDFLDTTRRLFPDLGREGEGTK